MRVPRRLVIQIRKKLTKEQYIKLFSNPVSGIACDMNGAAMNDFMTYCIMVNILNNIRYSKSMILKALNFWFDQIHSYYLKIYKIRKNSLIDVSEHIVPYMVELRNIMNMIESLPNTFLFSHRHIQDLNINKYRNPNGLADQNLLLKTTSCTLV